jgi:hypothetical protein
MNFRKLVFVAMLAAPTSALPAVQPDFGWLAGSWCLEGDGKLIEETWLPARGGLMVGINRETRAASAGFEFLRIEAVSGVPNYIAQPGGRPPVHFKLVSHGAGFARFENPAHDFPQFIEYRRTGDLLEAQVGALPREGAKSGSIRYPFHACAPTAQASR